MTYSKSTQKNIPKRANTIQGKRDNPCQEYLRTLKQQKKWIQKTAIKK